MNPQQAVCCGNRTGAGADTLGGGRTEPLDETGTEAEQAMRGKRRHPEGAKPGPEIVAEWDPDERSWLEAFRAELQANHAGKVKDMVIYGSKARGDWHRHSDIDVLLILADEAAAERETIEDLGYDLSVTADALPLLTSRTEAEWAAEAGTSFHETVEREGVSVR